MVKQNKMDTLKAFHKVFLTIREMSQRVDYLIQPLAIEEEITPLQAKVIITLGSARDFSLTMGQLGKNVGVSGGNISNICKKIEALGYIERNRAVRDERVVCVELTEKGKEFCRRADTYFEEYDANGEAEESLRQMVEDLQSAQDVLEGGSV